MDAETSDRIDSAISKMADQAKANQDAQKSLHFSQAALNLAHTKSVLLGCGSPPKPKKTEKVD